MGSARASIKKPAIMILDEASPALDSKTESFGQSEMARRFEKDSDVAMK